jgi:hypothetical protein
MSNIVSGYSVYQNSYLNSTVQNTKAQDKTQKSDSAKKTDETKKTDSSSVQLSDKAKALLQELKEKYTDMDFFVTESEDDDLSSYNSYSTKDYSVYIDAEELERMAEDEDVKNQNLALLDEAVSNLDEIKGQLEDSENGDQVVNLGVVIGKDGNVSYFAELEKTSERQKEFIENMRAAKKEAAEEAEEEAAEKKAEEAESEKDSPDFSSLLNRDQYGLEKEKRTTVYGSSVEELLEKINGVNWDDIAEQTVATEPGSHFDLSI